jgi:TIR domain
VNGESAPLTCVGDDMYRIFTSHSSVKLREATARKDWLVQQDPTPANEIILDADMMCPGVQWKDQLKQAMKNCEAVVCLTSKSWTGRPECLAEFRIAEYLNKRIFSARLEPPDADEATSAWQRVDLWGEWKTEIPRTPHRLLHGRAPQARRGDSQAGHRRRRLQDEPGRGTTCRGRCRRLFR